MATQLGNPKLRSMSPPMRSMLKQELRNDPELFRRYCDWASDYDSVIRTYGSAFRGVGSEARIPSVKN